MSLLAITFISDTRLYKRILHWLGRAVCIVLILTSLYLPTGSDAIAGTTRADKALLSMQKAYARNNTKQLNALLPRVKGHPLESLAAYWTRKSNLANATPQDMATFFARWQGTYWEDRLRNDWMLLLIKRQDWETLLRVHPRFRMQDDPQVECGVWRAQRASGRAAQGLSDKRMVDLWFQESSGHTACLGAVSDLVADKKVSNDTLWIRARQGAEWGSRSTMLGALALIDKRSGANGKTLYKQPYTWLLKNMPSLARNRTQAGKNKTSEWLSLGLIRMAAHNNKAFDKAFKRWKKHLRPEQQQAVQAVVATRMALRGNAAAHDLFLNIAPAHLSDRQREWQVRAALRAGDWSAVLASIDTMSSTQKSDSRWQFWRARAMQASTKQGQRARATAVLTQLATSDDFYGLLAKQTLGQAIRRPVDGPRPTAAAVKRVAADPNIKAARSAYALGLTKEAARQWTYAVALHQPGGMAQADLAAVEARKLSEEHAELDELSDEALLEKLELPNPDEMAMGDDFSGFMSKSVPDRLRRRALRTLWRSNPVLANVDNLVDYGEDFTDAALAVENIQTAYQVGKGMLKHVQEMVRQEEERLNPTIVEAELGEDKLESEAEAETPINLERQAEEDALAFQTSQTGDEPDELQVECASPMPRRMKFIAKESAA